jgi:hypothetical protein
MKWPINALGGYELDLPDGDWISRTVATGEPYEHLMLAFGAALVRDGTVVDAGAHAGNHTVYWAKGGATVHAFEPNVEIRRFSSAMSSGMAWKAK